MSVSVGRRLGNTVPLRSWFFFLLLSISLSVQVLASEKKPLLAYQGFSGGMMPHVTYLFGGQTPVYDRQGQWLTEEGMQGWSTGLGGAVRFHFGEHCRLGAEGYGNTLHYGQYGSSISLGWGGVLTDYHWERGKFKPFIGATLGGGVVRNLTLLQDTPRDFMIEEVVSYRKYPFMALSPFVGTEYALNQKMHLIFKIDYLMNLSNPQEDFVHGPRIYIGFMFYHINP